MTSSPPNIGDPSLDWSVFGWTVKMHDGSAWKRNGKHFWHSWDLKQAERALAECLKKYGKEKGGHSENS